MRLESQKLQSDERCLTKDVQETRIEAEQWKGKLTTKCCCVFDNFYFGSVCRADRVQSNGSNMRPLANFHIELEHFAVHLRCLTKDVQETRVEAA